MDEQDQKRYELNGISFEPWQFFKKAI